MSRPTNLLMMASALILSACVSGGGTATEMVSATSGLRALSSVTEAPSEADSKLSCADLNSRLANLYGRYEELDREQRARQRQAAFVGGIVNVGATLAGGSALAHAGSASAIRNVGLATNYGTAALTNLTSQESSTQQLKDVNDTMLIARRITQLERVKFDKSCGS